jgi:hypothetical protein
MVNAYQLRLAVKPEANFMMMLRRAGSEAKNVAAALVRQKK